ERGLSPETAVLAASFIGPMQVAGRLAMMMSEKYISHHGVALTAFALIAASVALLWLGQGAPVTLSGFVMLFAGAYGTVSILRPLIARDILGGRDFGAKSGALALPYLIGSASAPWLGAVVWRAGGYGLMFAILIGLMALGCGLYLAAHNRAGRDSAKANT
ncbi:MAG: MFS transporter, partial [Rhodobacteraceae bacterium]|nr:MFS transporter [Paracoccaceae bacterium]